jgi:hypothetical protein
MTAEADDADDAEMVPDTTDRILTVSFANWTFDTGMPERDLLQRMCGKAAWDAVQDLVNDIWLYIDFSDGRGATCPKRLEVCIHAWDGAVSIGRPFAEVMAETAETHSYSDGSMDDDNASVLEIVRELEAALAMFKRRMRPRETLS